MTKRIAAAGLWFLVGWFVGDVFAYALGLPEVLAVVLGTAAAVIFAGDPFRVIWKPTSLDHAAASPALGAPTAALDL
jgi:hypothetical protein